MCEKNLFCWLQRWLWCLKMVRVYCADNKKNMEGMEEIQNLEQKVKGLEEDKEEKEVKKGQTVENVKKQAEDMQMESVG